MERNYRALYSEARITKNRNYDGRFFFGVKTTGVFCRPSCPAPVAKEANVEYFSSIFEALDAGYRPCRRCRPDLNLEYHNSYIPGSELVQQALNLIYNGFLNYNSLKDLAAELYISERRLRALFIECIGLPPVKVGRYHKAVFAKKLLTGSDRPVTEIAFASGFRSIRQFNDTYREIFGESPSATRKNNFNTPKEHTILRLKYRSPFDFRQILTFMEPRLIKGVEVIKDNRYCRSFRTEKSSGWFSVSDRPEDSALELSISSNDVRCYMEIYYRVRKMFDLDTDFSVINKQLGSDPLLSAGMKDGQVPRLPTAFDAFEFTIRAILGQQITIKAATTLAGRIAEKTAIRCPEDFPPGLDYYFPGPQDIDETPLENIGITGIRQQTIKRVVHAVLTEELSLSSVRSFETFEKNFSAVKGIGAWTVNYVAMRGLGILDAFPASDLDIIKAFTTGDEKPRQKDIIARAEHWRPYRSYAALCIWHRHKKKE